MKKYNVAIAIPSPDVVLPEFALDNLPAIIAQAKKSPYVNNVFLTYQKGVRTDKNRNVILNRILESGMEVDYILWLDADMLFPHDILDTYFKFVEQSLKKVDIIGCLYFKRGDTFEPIVYVKNPNKQFSYMNLDPRKITTDVMEVDALGFGGMMVSMDLYNRMGDDKWSVYGEEFHIPTRTGNQLTHDINFCRIAQEKYTANIFCHFDVKPGHIGEQVVTQKTWEDLNTGKVGRIREHNVNTKEYWDKKYQTGEDEYLTKHEKQKARWDLALKYINNKDHVIDFGCGTGEFLRYVCDNRKHILSYGVDISEHACITAKKKVRSGLFYPMDLDKVEELEFNWMEHTEFKETIKFNVAFCGETLEHVNNPENIIKQAYINLVDGGKLVITTPNKNAIDSVEHVNSFDVDTISTMLIKQGFTIEESDTLFDGKILYFVAKK